MQVHALLENRRAEVIAEIEKLKTELIEIDRMMSASQVPVTARPQMTPDAIPLPRPANKDEAILQAIGNGCKTPAAISDFIRNKLGLEVNDASTRTRLSRMKSADKIAHDGFGWTLKG